jgi:hypothetical protein
VVLSTFSSPKAVLAAAAVVAPVPPLAIAKVPAKVEDVKPVKVKAVKIAPLPKEEKVNDKKVAAQRLFDANQDKNNGAIARLISAELEISYANAYYYVTRVFKR